MTSTPRTNRPPDQGVEPTVRGFTLIELMVTLTVAMILLAIAVPSFTYVTVSSRLTTTANELVTALTVARSEAIKRNVPVAFCGKANNSGNNPGKNCGTTKPGAVMYVPPPPPANAAVITARDPITLPPNINLSTLNGVTFDGTGLGYDNNGAPFSKLLADVNSSRISTNNHRCIYLTTGTIVSSCVVSGTGACPNAQPTPCNR